jgi:hypothetical protein
VWRAVDLELAKSNAFSFGDLLAYAVGRLAEHPTGSHTCAAVETARRRRDAGRQRGACL